MKIVIMGCGRVGARLASLLEQDGHDLSIIDSDPGAFDRLPENFTGQTVLGTGIDVDVLKSAGIEKADAFAAVTNYDNTNIMACEVVREIFGVQKVLARIYDPGRESFYHQLGLETVCPTTLISTTARNILVSDEPHASATSAPEGTTSLTAPEVQMPGSTAQVMVTPGTSPVAQPMPTDRSAQAQKGQEPARSNGRSLRGFFRP